MTFISLLFVTAAFIGTLLVLGIAPIIIGTILIKKSSHKKLGVALRIFGYIISVPLIAGPIICLIAGKFA